MNIFKNFLAQAGIKRLWGRICGLRRADGTVCFAIADLAAALGLQVVQVALLGALPFIARAPRQLPGTEASSGDIMAGLARINIKLQQLEFRHKADRLHAGSLLGRLYAAWADGDYDRAGVILDEDLRLRTARTCRSKLHIVARTPE